MAEWVDVSPDEMGGLAQAREQLHWAVQVLGAVGRNLAEAEDDWGHTTITWNSELAAFVSQPAPGLDLRLAMRPRDFALLRLTEDLSVLKVMPLAGRSLADTDAFAASELASARGSEVLLDADAGFELDDSPLAHGAAFRSDLSDQFATFTALYHNGLAALAEFTGALENASAVRCWPHHFDLAVLHRLDVDGDLEEARSIGIGMSPGDGSYNEPYFYVTPWPYPEGTELPELRAGHWHTEDWIGGVLRLSELPLGAADQRAVVQTFLSDAHQALLHSLG